MLAVGSLLAGAGILFAGLLALLFRNPRAPGWARPEAVAFLATVPVAGLIGFGFGYVGYGFSALLRGEGGLWELAVFVGVALLIALVWHALGIRERLRAYAATCAPASVAIAGVQLAGAADRPPGKAPRPPTRTTG